MKNRHIAPDLTATQWNKFGKLLQISEKNTYSSSEFFVCVSKILSNLWLHLISLGATDSQNIFMLRQITDTNICLT